MERDSNKWHAIYPKMEQASIQTADKKDSFLLFIERVEFINFRWWHKWIIPQIIIICLFMHIVRCIHCNYVLVLVTLFLTHQKYTRKINEFTHKDCGNTPLGVIVVRSSMYAWFKLNEYFPWTFWFQFFDGGQAIHFRAEHLINLMMNLILIVSAIVEQWTMYLPEASKHTQW